MALFPAIWRKEEACNISVTNFKSANKIISANRGKELEESKNAEQERYHRNLFIRQFSGDISKITCRSLQY